MRDPDRDQDAILVKRCLSGSQTAWNDFYQKYIGLVRSVVRRRLSLSAQEGEDVSQNVFAALVSSLGNYDPSLPLHSFISTIAERVCIQEYRWSRRAKRYAVTNPVDHHDTDERDTLTLMSHLDSPEDRLAGTQLVEILRQGLRKLDPKCRQILRFRYYDELPYREIEKKLNTPGGTLAVRSKRCVDQLRVYCRRLLKRGLNS
jgi:RNA polymerase sigma-70 factor (ECF subfamily)